MTRVSTFGQNQLIVSQMLRNQAQLFESQQQVTTGRKSTYFEGYARENNTLIATKTVISQKDAFLKSNAELDARLEIQNLSLGAIAGEAEALRQQVIKTTGLNDGTGFNLEVEGVLDTLIGLLNTQHQGSYVFAGTNTDQPPVNITSAADLLALPSVADAFDNNTIKLSQKIDDNRTMEYGVLADEIAAPILESIQRLLQFESGVLPPGAGAFAPPGSFQSPLTQNQQQFLANELSGIVYAIDQIRDVEALNGVRMESLASLEERQIQDRDFGRALAGEIEDVDMAEAVSNLRADEIQLEASLNVTSRLLRVSLLDFI